MKEYTYNVCDVIWNANFLFHGKNVILPVYIDLHWFETQGLTIRNGTLLGYLHL